MWVVRLLVSLGDCVRGGVGGRNGRISFERNLSKSREPLLGNVLMLLLPSGKGLVAGASLDVMAEQRGAR